LVNLRFTEVKLLGSGAFPLLKRHPFLTEKHLYIVRSLLQKKALKKKGDLSRDVSFEKAPVFLRVLFAKEN